VVNFNPFAGPEISQVTPITESQMEIWLSCALGGDEANSAYNESNSLHFKGIVNVPALEHALQVLVERHEALRSSFSGNGKFMVVYKDLPNPLAFLDISPLSTSERKSVLEEVLLQDSLHVFNLIDGPLFKATLLKFDGQDYYFVFTGHHLIIDGWSIGVIMQELGIFYSSFVQGKEPGLPSPKSFSEFAIEQKQFLESISYRGIEKYWLDQFETNVPVLSLPTDHPRPKTKTYKSHRLEFELDPVLVSSIKKVGLKAGGTFVNTLMTAFEVFLYQITGQNDIIIGLPASGQAALGYYDLVGHCVNLLPIRSQIDGKLTFSEYLSARKPQIFDAYEHQRLTFGSLLKNLKIARDSSRIPLVPVVFNVDFGKDDGVDFHGLEFEMISNPKAYLNFELFLNVNGSEDSVVLEWTYNSQLFNPDSIWGMIESFNRLLQQLVADPEMKLKEFSQVNNHMLEKLKLWNNTDKDFPTDIPFVKLFHDVAVKFPAKTAIEFYGETATYDELDKKSSQLAAYLIDKGTRSEDIIGVFMDRSPEMVIALLGICKAGGAYLPLDPEYPKERIRYMLQDSQAKLVISNQHLKETIDATVDTEVIEDIFLQLPSFSSGYPEVDINGHSLAYILYTSGSTGNPKGVQIEHHNLTNFLLSMQLAPGISAEDRILAITTISFDIAGLELYLPLISGATIVLADTNTARDGRLLLKWMEEKAITLMQATPSTWRMLGNAGWNRLLPLKALCGGEALPQDLEAQLLANCTSVWNVYGPTETTVWSTVKELNPMDKVITVGRPIHNTQVYLLDEERDPVPEGKIGEIYIGGEGVARGYLNRNELTSERFFNDHFSEKKNARMYRTGDLGQFLEDGEIICLGRVDHQVKIRGHRIELGEIEEALVKIPEIKEAVVMAREDIPGNQRLAAYLIMDGRPVGQENKPSKKEVSSWKNDLQQSLPSYMIPNDWVILEKFPLTSNQKVDRKALPRPGDSMDHDSSLLTLPLTKSQQLVSDIWSRSLGIENIDIHDDFFEIGGHSLIAVEVMTRLEKECNVKFPLSILFEYPTIAKLAALVQSKESKREWKSLVPIKSSGSNPPLYIVHGGGLNVLPFYSIAKHLDPEQPLYGIQAYGLNGTDAPFTTIEAIAEQYVNEILAQNPDGPIALAGYSFGGIIAFEMAKQFQSIGREIKPLIMFDTYAIRSDHRDPLWVRFPLRITTEIGKRIFELKMLINNPALFKRLKKKSLQHKIAKVKKVIKLKESEPETEIFEIINKIKRVNIEAGKNYILSPYDGEIYLFKAKTRTSYERDFKYFGWKNYVNKVHIVEMEGEHTTMFEPPHEKAFVKQLQKILTHDL
jgi:amino acid adenylation domain-containing protein